MTTPAVVTGDDTAKGITRMAFNNKTKIGFTYDGSIDAFGAVYFYVPSDRLGIAITSNGQNYPSGEIFWTVLRIVYGAREESGHYEDRSSRGFHAPLM
ncbi:MAG TPA: hypothetical protein VGB76_21550 [Pyrinomonadaceae bacterium]|jgi:hypothetical protein